MWWGHLACKGSLHGRWWKSIGEQPTEVWVHHARWTLTVGYLGGSIVIMTVAYQMMRWQIAVALESGLVDQQLKSFLSLVQPNLMQVCLERVQTSHTHTHPFNSPLSRTTRVSRYQKGKTSLDLNETGLTLTQVFREKRPLNGSRSSSCCAY